MAASRAASTVIDAANAVTVSRLVFVLYSRYPEHRLAMANIFIAFFYIYMIV